MFKRVGTTYTASSLGNLILLQLSGSLLFTQIPLRSLGILGVSGRTYIKLDAWHIGINIFYSGNKRIPSK